MHGILETLLLFLVLTFPLSNSNKCSHLSNSGRSVLRNKPRCILITSKICCGIERIKYLPSSWGLFKLQSEKQHCKILLLCTTWEPLGAIRVAPQVYMEGSPWLFGVAFSTGGFPASEHFYSNLAGKPLKAAKGYENSFTVWLLDLLWWREQTWGEEP